ncbi:MAG TPA: alpha/beta hydrolase [Streptosporangiaceae bacterium]|nr:alpha/beta hydrolase [Streptosporangiaceae bacterium]
MKRVVVIGAAAGLGLAGLGLTGSAGAGTAAPAAPAKAAAGSLSWAPCTDESLEGLGLECATLRVPLDYRKPHGRQITLALSRAKHTGTADQYQGAMLVNPGGPGGEGRSYAARVFNRAAASVKQAYDVIGFDPRGVAASEPSLSCDPDYFLPVRQDYVPRSVAEENSWRAKAAGYAKACGDKYGAVLDHMKTVDSVRDMDSIRAALGVSQINYYGASYGTYLGSVYATAFPNRVRRMVLDSNVRPSGVWYDDNLDQDRAFDRNINTFFAWVAQYDSVYHVGATASSVRRFYYDLRAKLRTAPVAGEVGPDELDDSFLVLGYIDRGPYWDFFASVLSAVKAGHPEALVDAYENFGLTTDDNGYAVYNAVQCTDVQWPTSWAKWRHDNAKVYREAPFETWGNAWYNAACLTWPGETGRPVHVGNARHLPSILLFQATEDAPTPLGGGLEMHKLLRGSRLVIEDGGRTHGVVGRGNACVDDKFTAYLTTGALPADFSHCDHLPYPVPPAASSAGSAASSASSSPSTLAAKSAAARAHFPEVLGRR